MDPDPRHADLVEPLRSDVVSGASVLAARAADILRRAAVRLQAGSIEELRWGLGEVSRLVLDAQPAMAPLVSLVRDVLVAVEAADSLERGRHLAASAAEGFRAELDTRAAAVARAAAELLPNGGTIATVSSSSTVRRLLESEAAPRGLSVLCFESRPVNEGRRLAASLVESGVEVRYAVDAAMHRLVRDCDVVLLGADSIGDAGVVNKIGSAGLVQSARAFSVPVLVLADDTKVLPRGFPQILDDDRPGTEVWDAPAGVAVWNRYFEIVPMAHVSRIVTEQGPRTPVELERRRAEMELPPGLRVWAASRRTVR